jgi:hypothetical protein
MSVDIILMQVKFFGSLEKSPSAHAGGYKHVALLELKDL